MRTIIQTSALALAALTAAAGCSPALCESGDCENRVIVARNIAFATEQPGGVAEGFDLDDIVSTGTDTTSCNREDYVAPDGREGIDNQFAVLWDAIVNVIGDAVDGLILGAINDGFLLFMIELDGIDDLENDDCVRVEIYVGEGKPIVGTDGYIASSQTFGRGDKGPLSVIECGTIVDGVLDAGPFDGELPISILDVSFDLEVFDARFRGRLNPDGTVTAVLGAAIDSAQIIEVGEGADYRLEGLVGPLVRNRSDMARDEFGDCQRLSATMLYDGTTAFFYD